jgi:TM2 domain-containing membrane protein YozV
MAGRRMAAMLPADMQAPQTHSKVIGYFLWIFGFLGAHRFYFGRPITGTIWFFTLGLLGRIDYSVAWLLQTFIGPLGIHRFYMGKIWTGLLWLFTGGLVGIGWLYDFWTLNGQIDERNGGG